MSAERDFFVDTNVFLYLLSDDQDKADRSELILARGGVISVQVVNEFAQVARRKLGTSWAAIAEITDVIRAICSIEPLTEQTYLHGCQLAPKYQLSVFDSMIVASALGSGCTTLYSEDMHDTLVVEKKLTIANPFAQ